MNSSLLPFRHTPSLVVAFGVTVAMWIVGFMGRLPSIQLDSKVLFGLLVVCLAGGGLVLGRCSRFPVRQAAESGAICALLNMMVLFSVLSSLDSPNSLRPSAMWWIPGFILSTMLVMTLGAILFKRRKTDVETADDPMYWTSMFTRVTSVLTFFLLLVGGLVTSHEAGLAVPDWPNSYGSNMFLFPLSRMVGGIYYEHTHRLFGSLVGLNVLVMTLQMWIARCRRDIRWLSLGILLLVIGQGVLGGLRVTGKITDEVSPEAMEPSVHLAILHGVLGQVVFVLMIALVAMTSKAWAERKEVLDPSIDRFLTVSLMGILLLQLILGAVVRHLHVGQTTHIIGAVMVVVIAITCGVRSWGKYGPEHRVFHQLGIGLMVLVGVQFVLGLFALIFSIRDEKVDVRPMTDLIFTSAHQAVGAIVLGVSLALTLFVWRILVSPTKSEGANGLSP